MGELPQNMQKSYSFVEKHIQTTNETTIAQIDKDIRENTSTNALVLKDYERCIVTAEDRELWTADKAASETYDSSLEAVLRLSRANRNTEAFDLFVRSVDPAFGKYSKAVQAHLDYNRTNGVAAGERITAAISSSRLFTFVGLVTALVLAGGISFITIRGTNRVLTTVASALNEGSRQVASASSQVSASSQSLAEGASEQAASLEETSSSLEEMSSMTKRNTESAEKVNELARQARAAADTGATDMQAMAVAMNEIKASSDDIAKIIKTIDEIAFQTNILALNAAVEAARAGEAGMGFAVVADEVRNLAQRAAQSAKETSSKIENALDKTTQGVQLSEKVSKSLQEILGKVRQVDELAAEVAGASKEQSQGIQQVNTAVTQMDKVTQSNAANAEETASAAEELQAQARALQEAVGELMKLVGGSAGTATTPKASTAATGVPRHQTKVIGSGMSNPKHNGHGRQTSPLASVSAHREALPMDGEFKDF
jgi:methyl-accepting chemotaxis protein